MFIHNTYSVIPFHEVSHIYGLQEIVCIAIIVLLILSSILEIKLWSKILLSIVSGIIAVLHYYVLYMVSRYESIIFYPLIYIEATKHGSTFTIDYGQLMIILIIFLWRRRLIGFIKNISSRLWRRRGV